MSYQAINLIIQIITLFFGVIGIIKAIKSKSKSTVILSVLTLIFGIVTIDVFSSWAHYESSIIIENLDGDVQDFFYYGGSVIIIALFIILILNIKKSESLKAISKSSKKLLYTVWGFILLLSIYMMCVALFYISDDESVFWCAFWIAMIIVSIWGIKVIKCKSEASEIAAKETSAVKKNIFVHKKQKNTRLQSIKGDKKNDKSVKNTDAVIRCAKCNKPVNPNNVYCFECGHKIE